MNNQNLESIAESLSTISDQLVEMNKSLSFIASKHDEVAYGTCQTWDLRKDLSEYFYKIERYLERLTQNI